MKCNEPMGCPLPFDQCCGRYTEFRRQIYNANTGKYEEQKTFEKDEAWLKKMSKLTNTQD